MHIYNNNPFHFGYGKRDLWQTVKALMKYRIRWFSPGSALFVKIRTIYRVGGGGAGVKQTMRITLHFWHMA